jgi:hypothetical protein
MINRIYYFTIIKMNPLDPEGQFYPFISTAIRGNEDPTVVLHIVFLSFHEQSSNPPPLSSIWDI